MDVNIFSGSFGTNNSAVALGQITGLATNVAAFLATPSSANLAAAVTDETGTGALVFGTAPAIARPLRSASTYTATAAGTDSATALLVSSEYTRFTTVASGTGGRFSGSLGNNVWCYVRNAGANALTMYPPSGGTIDGGASVSMPVGQLRVFIQTATNTWISEVIEG